MFHSILYYSAEKLLLLLVLSTGLRSCREYLWACPPLLGAHTSVLFHLLWGKLHQLAGLDLTSTERTPSPLLSIKHRMFFKKAFIVQVFRTDGWCKLKQKKKWCWERKVYLLVADDLGDAGSAVNVGAVRDDGQIDGVQAHGALLVGAAGQHQAQLFYQTLPQLCGRRRRACTHSQEVSAGERSISLLDIS